MLPSLEAAQIAAVLQQTVEPIPAPWPGTFLSPITVSLSAYSASLIIHCTARWLGSDARLSRVYSAPIRVSTPGQTVLRAFAEDIGLG